MSVILCDTKGNARGQLNAGITAGSATLVLKTGEGAEFPQPLWGNCSSLGSSTVLNDTGALGSLAVGDFIRNVTDGSWAFVLSIGGAPDSVTTTPLRGGSDNTWQNNDEWAHGEFEVTAMKTDDGTLTGNVVRRERILIKDRTSDQLSVRTRGYAGSVAASYDADDFISLTITNTMMDNIIASIKDVAGLIGPIELNVTALQGDVPVWCGAVTGTDTLTASGTPTLSGSYPTGVPIAFIVANTNTGAVTLNINGLGAVGVVRNSNIALVAGDLLAGSVHVVIYDGTDFNLMTPVGNSGAGVPDVSNKTWHYSILAAEAEGGDVFTNLSAAIPVQITAPSAVVGSRIRVIVRAAENFFIRAASGDFIRNAATITTATQPAFYSATVGNSFEALCVGVDDWIVTSLIGTWNLWSMKGYAAGGNTGVYQTAIDDMNFTTETSAAIAATVSSGGSWAGVSSKAAGYFGGRDNGSVQSTIEDMIFGTETSDAIAATLNTARFAAFGVQSATKGYFIGGWNGASYNTTTAEDLNFATETSDQIASALGTGKGSGGSASSSLAGYMAGGTTGSDVDTVAKFTFSGESASLLAAVLSSARNNMYNSSQQSTTKGYFAGGHTSVVVATINALTFSNESMATLAATLDTAKQQMGTVAGVTKGYFMGAGATGNVIEDITYATDASAAIAATLDTGRGEACGVYCI